MTPKPELDLKVFSTPSDNGMTSGQIKRRVFILAEREFPSGNAGGTRVRYLAKMLQELGNDVTVIALGENAQKDYDINEKCYIFDGIKYQNTGLPKGVFRFFGRYLLSGLRAIRELKSIDGGGRNNDTVIVYTSNVIYAALVLTYVRNRYIAWVDIVEWFQKESFRFGAIDPKYGLYQICFNIFYPITGKVIAISSRIEREFARRGCQTVRIPCLYSTDVAMRFEEQRNRDNKIRLIYSGNPGKKEKLTVMLQALEALSTEKRDRFEFHFTGVSKRVVKTLLATDGYLLDRLSDIIYFHPWMEYDNLLGLYCQMNYLYFIRESTLPNLANFPMKLPELMSFGVVPITTRVGDYGEYLEDGVNSIIVPDTTLTSCQYALSRVLDLADESFYTLSLGAKECVNKNFDYRSFAKKCDFEKAGL